MMKLKRIFSVLLTIVLMASLLVVPAFAADNTLTLQEDWRLTSDLDLEVPEGTTLTIDGNGHHIYEMGGKLLNSGGGTVAFEEGTILYPAAGDTNAARFTPKDGWDTEESNALMALRAESAGYYGVKIESSTNGTVTVNKLVAKAGDTVTVTTESANGYGARKLLVKDNNKTGPYSDFNGSPSCSFEMPASDVTIEVTFGKKPAAPTFFPAGGTYSSSQTVSITVAEGSTGYYTTDGSDPTQNSDKLADSITISSTTTLKAVAVMDGVYSEVATATYIINTGGGGGGSSTPTKTPSQQTADKIESATDGATVEITLRTGQTTLDKEVFEELSGKDVTLEISVPGGVTWTVNGQDIPADAKLSDLNLSVSMNTSAIPVSVINAVTGTVDTIQLSLQHDGEFGFTMTLTAPLGKTNAGYWANLYYYNKGTTTLEFQWASKITADGTASFPFDHASDYAIVIDTENHEPVELPFTDVTTGSWYYDAVDFVYQNELMNGTSDTTFAPNGTMTRAMLVTILHRQAGEPQVNYAMPFTDVASGTWYAEAVRWAAAEGVVTGTSDTTFSPDTPITREQFATILYRYAQQSGADVSVGEDTNILSYADALDISEYAVPAMQWACGAGVIEGSGANLNPQNSATRAEAATMLMRFVTQVG